MIDIILLLFYVFTPLFILHLCHRFPWVNKLGAIMIAYGIGLILGNLNIIPSSAKGLQDIITAITVPLAIPLMLFSADMRSWIHVAGKTFLSMIIAIFSVVIMVVLGYIFFKNGNNQSFWKVGGLLIGVYTGGTPNIAALKLMLNVNNNVFLLVNTYDMVISAVYFFFLITVAQKVFQIVLPKFKTSLTEQERAQFKEAAKDPYWGILQKKNFIPLLKGLGLSILIFAIGGGLMMIVPVKIQMIVVILTITTLGILASLIPGVNRIPKTFELGMYLILIFSIDVASMVNISEMFGSSMHIFYYVALVIFGSLFLQVFISSFFKIDADTTIVTSTAMICSPPFVPAVAGALKNKEIVISGLTVGIIGYAIGNYLGVVIAEMLKAYF